MIESYNMGFKAGTIIGHFIPSVGILTFIFASIYYLLKQKEFRQIILNWKIIIPSILISLMPAIPEFKKTFFEEPNESNITISIPTVAPSTSSVWSPNDIQQFESGCRIAFQEKMINEKLAHIYCECLAQEGQKLYSKTSDLLKAYKDAKGSMPEAMVEPVARCGQKVNAEIAKAQSKL